MLKALGMYIFGGSQTLGHIKAGWNVDTILEMTEDMLENNAYHFHKNFPEINMLVPSQWKNNLNDFVGKYDLVFANNPCSGLSSINRNAKVDNDVNKRFYEVIEVVETIKPKVFMFENAPTLTNLGLPILKNIVNRLKSDYCFTIINDIAGNHNVSMYRRRTLFVGWNKKYFKSVPNISANIEPLVPVSQILAGLDSNSLNMEPDIHAINTNLTKYYSLVNQGETVMMALRRHINEIEEDDIKNKVILFDEKCKQKDSVWNKFAYRVIPTDRAPSMTSMSQFIHPTENRDFYIREYARIMGYPDNFKFYQEECKCSTIQCLAQGVPVNFIYYISSQIKKSLENPVYIDIADVIYINQCSGIQKKTLFTYDEFFATTKINENKISNELDFNWLFKQ